MRSFFLSWCLLGLLAGSPVVAEEQETALWKTVGNWAIYIDRTAQYQCFIVTVYRDSTIFRVGFEAPGSQAALYVALGNPNWTSLEEGKDYDLVMQINNGTRWTSPARAMKFATLPALIVTTNQLDFVEQLMRKHSLQVWFKGRRILDLSLQGSHAALREMAECQNQVDTYLGTSERNAQPNDPFADEATPIKKDPFAY